MNKIRKYEMLFVVAAFFVSVCTSAADRSSPANLSSLPLAAQSRISAALGEDLPAYQVQGAVSGLQTANPNHELDIQFTRKGVHVRNGAARWAMGLQGYGYGNRLVPIKWLAPQSRSNRVEYRRGALTEWYVNGPMGLEQGFTLSQSPAKSNGQPLTIALAVSGNLSMALNQDRTSVMLNDMGGKTLLRYSGLCASDARGQELRAWMEVQKGQLLLKVDDSNAFYPVMVDPWVRLARLTASDGRAGEYFGTSVAIWGDTVVVGAPYVTVGSINFAQGAAYVFVKPTTGWANLIQVAKLTAPAGLARAGDHFGSSVAIWGDKVLVGAPNGTLGGSSSHGGDVYLFVKPSSGWRDMTATAWGGCGPTGALCGQSVAIKETGDLAVIGAPGFYSPYPSYQQFVGGALVIPMNGTGLALGRLTHFSPSDGQSGDGLGSSVAFVGNTVVAGSPNANGRRGAVYVFHPAPEGWCCPDFKVTETAKLTASDGQAEDYLGASVSMISDTLVAGAPLAQIGSHRQQGAAYVFLKPPASDWTNSTETAKLTARYGNASDEFGESVAIGGGNRVVVGAPGAKIGSPYSTGAAYVFAKPQSGWVSTSQFVVKLKASDLDMGFWRALGVGFSVAISNGTIVAGAPYSTLGSSVYQGSAYVFGQLTVLSFTPTTGPIGTPVVITGKNLGQTTAVAFGGVNSSKFTVNSDTQVTADVPAGAITGKISITTPGGTAKSARTFTVTP